MRLASPSSHEINASSTGSFGDPRRTRKALGDVEAAGDELAGELRTNHEVMEKVKGLEGKLEYQIKKLVGLAEAERGKGTEVVEGIEEGKKTSLNSSCAVSDSLFRPIVIPA
jgi:U3 small nucleolar ribonucleoprotein protein LCP5